MNLAVLSLIVFLITVVIGVVTKVNCGLVAMISGFILTTFFVKDISFTDLYTESWPSKIFFMMMAVTLLFGMAGANGTMKIIAQKLIGLMKGKSRIMPLFIFVLTFLLSSTGGGPGVAPMIIPIAMGLCAQTGMSVLMMGVMIEAAAGAGGMSPVATNGIIAKGFAEQAGATEYLGMYIPYVLIMVVEALAVYFWRGGYKVPDVDPETLALGDVRMNKEQKLTTGVIVAVICSVLIMKVDVAAAAMVGASFLLVVGVMKDKKAIMTVNWNTLMLVAGMYMLIQVVTVCGGIDLISKEIMKMVTPKTGTGVMCTLSGLLAVVTSSSGVVMPTLIPVCKSIAASTGVSVNALAAGVCIGANCAFYSPFSVLGSMTMSMYPETVDRDKIFIRHLQITGASIAFASLLTFSGFVSFFL